MKKVIMNKDKLLNIIKNIEDTSVLDYLSQYHKLSEDIFKTHNVIICGFGNSMIRDLTPQIKDKVNIVAIIDDALQGQYFNDINIFGSEYLDEIDTRRLLAISGVFSKNGVNYFKQLMESKNIQLVQFDLAQYFLHVKLQYNYYNELIENTIRHKDKLIELFDTLDDDRSKEVLENLLMYRLTLDKKYINEIEISNKEQYFAKDIIRFTNKEVFVDCGAFDGDTYEIFSSLVQNKFERYYAFEPDSDNYNSFVAKTCDDIRVLVENKGLWDKTQTLYFNSTSNHTSKIDTEGTNEVNVVALDDLNLSPTFIKMDIEGSELKALYGMKKTIEKHKPNLALSVYHKPNDLFEIANYILSINPNYKIYLRHYSNDIFDTIAYFKEN